MPLYQLSHEATQLGAGQFVGLIWSWVGIPLEPPEFLQVCLSEIKVKLNCSNKCEDHLSLLSKIRTSNTHHNFI